MPADPFANFVIARDTREPNPYKFDKQLELPAALTVDQCLKTGDYAGWNPNREVSSVVERKTLDDFVGSISDKRIWEQCSRLFEIEYAAIVIEATWKEVYYGAYHSKMLVQAVMGSIVKIQVDYGLCVMLGGDRAKSEYWTYKFLRRAYKKLEAKRVLTAPGEVV